MELKSTLFAVVNVKYADTFLPHRKMYSKKDDISATLQFYDDGDQNVHEQVTKYVFLMLNQVVHW